VTVQPNFFAALSLGGLLAASFAFAQGQAPARSPLSIIISTPNPTIKVGADLKIDEALTNTSREPLSGTPNGTLKVHDSKGKAVSEVEPPKADVETVLKDGTRAPVVRVLQGSHQSQIMLPGTTHFELVVNKYFDLSKPGTYTIQLSETFHGFVVNSNTVTVSVVPAETVGASSGKPRLSVALSAVEKTSKAGSKVIVDVLLTNTSSGRVLLPAGGGEDILLWYTIQVRRKDGTPVPESQLIQAQKRESSKPLPPGMFKVDNYSRIMGELQPGQTAKDRVVLSDLYDMSQPGDYVVQAERIEPANGAILKSTGPAATSGTDKSKAGTVVKSNSLTLTVTP